MPAMFVNVDDQLDEECHSGEPIQIRHHHFCLLHMCARDPSSHSPVYRIADGRRQADGAGAWVRRAQVTRQVRTSSIFRKSPAMNRFLKMVLLLWEARSARQFAIAV